MATEPVKIMITNLETWEEIEVQYNPTDFNLAKGAQLAEIAIPGLDSPLLQFIRGTNEKLTLKLFFNTTDDDIDVRDKTKKFYNLVKMDEHIHALPRCWITWGTAGMIKGDKSDFIGIAENVTQDFTLFKADGIPVRAEIEVTFREYKTLEEQIKKPKSYTRTRVIQGGDTLQSIAYEEYKDPSLWRTLADKNRITNPMRLKPGTIIAIPPSGE